MLRPDHPPAPYTDRQLVPTPSSAPRRVWLALRRLLRQAAGPRPRRPPPPAEPPG